MAKRKIKDRAFIKAVVDTGGIYTRIAMKLSVDRNTVASYLKARPDMQVYVDQETEKILDLAEDGLFAKVKNRDNDSIRWLLSRKGKKRGYGETLAITTDKEKSQEEEVAERLAKLNEANSTTAN